MDSYAAASLFFQLANTLGNTCVGVGVLLLAPYVYNLLFGEKPPSKVTVTRAQIGFFLFVAGFGAIHVFRLVSSLLSLESRFL